MSDNGEDLAQRLADERHHQVLGLLTDVRDKLAVQNGRVGMLERQVAVLEDRSPGRVGLITGSVGAGVVAGLYELVQAVTKHR